MSRKKQSREILCREGLKERGLENQEEMRSKGGETQCGTFTGDLGVTLKAQEVRTCPLCGNRRQILVDSWS